MKKRMKNNEEFNINYNLKIIQDLQYTNSVINNRNIYLEKELDFIKNKYNLCKQDLNEINKHISICKDNQDKIINDLKNRNDFLEKLNTSKNSNDNNNKLHLFIEKMRILFNDETQEVNDEDYLDKLSNNIIKMNEELILCRNELNKKIHENNKLKHEIQNMKLNTINLNNQINNNYNPRVKTPIGNYKEKLKYNNKDFDNNISIPKTPQLNIKDYIKNNQDNKFMNRKNNTINLDKKLINSRSYTSYKFKTLKENNDKENKDSNDIIQNLMNNVKHLENTFNYRPNNLNNNIYLK